MCKLFFSTVEEMIQWMVFKFQIPNALNSCNLLKKKKFQPLSLGFCYFSSPFYIDKAGH